MKKMASPLQMGEPEVLSRLLQLGLENSQVDVEQAISVTPERIEKVIAGYELFRELGRGGSGVVYLARQKNIQRLVAFKILGGHQFGDGTVRLRFQREAELVATLQHPRIVRIYEFGIWEELPFYSMQYIEGANLRERIRAGDLTWQQVVRWAASIAETVHFAHRKGVLHRDLKPENILIDLDEQLHLTDFGLARRIEETKGITLTGTVVGTPHYIAPEVLSSYGRDVSPAADLYAVGAILYEMLAGIPPFAGKNLAEIADNIRRRDPIPPSHISSDIPRQLDAICLKALRKKPRQRYADAQELAEALTSTLARSSSPVRLSIVAEKTVPRYTLTRRLAPYVFGLVSVFAMGALIFFKNSPTQTMQAAHVAGAPAVATKSPPSTSTVVTTQPVVNKVWTNSQGVKFVPAGTDGVLFSVWDVRVKDFKTFVDATGYDATAGLVSFGVGLWKQRGDTWRSPGFTQTEDDPVCGVSWYDAKAFCLWLTKKEQAEGKLASNQEYRLPTDAEWSRAVGLDEATEGTPKEKSDRVEKAYPWGTIFPWGTSYPPPIDAGNFNRSGDGSKVSNYSELPGYDGYPYTSPVGSFKPNSYGLFDMGGNVWNWCDDKFDGKDDLRVLRGSSCFTNAREHLLSSCRAGGEPGNRDVKLGFRVVMATLSSPAATPTSAPPNSTPTAAITKSIAGQPWTNSLDETFVPAGTDGVLFSVWDVRVKDFRTFVDTTGYDATAGMVSLKSDGWKPKGDTWKSPGFPQTDDCPVVGVSWNDANAFCDWLTQRERATGKLASTQSYRLPTDAEWSRAVGLSESDGGTPVSKSGVLSIYPWGTHQWPPPKGAGNYAGTEARDADWPSDRTSLDIQNDHYPRTSPVGSFVANRYGLYDMGGNVWNWCEDEYNPGVVNWRVLRGASWSDGGDPNFLRSSFRFPEVPEIRNANYGFRVVVVVTPQHEQ